MSLYKQLIVLEIVAVIGGHIVVRVAAGETYEDVVVHGLARPALAAVLVGAILLALAEAGFGGIATSFGGLIVLGYLLTAGGTIGTGAEQAVTKYFSTKEG